MTAKQRKNERLARHLEAMVGPNPTSRKWLADNKRVEKRKRAQYRHAHG